MADEQRTKLRLEIAHVLFLDIVGYSKLLIDEQAEALQELNQIVRRTEGAREAEAAGQLIILPTGDGMALVFTGSVEDPVECALQISQTLRAQPSPPVRMGIHSGPVHHVADVNQRENIAGAGINIAQRVMDCGDAGHILLSKRVADDLAQYRHWQPLLHDLGECEVKHGDRHLCGKSLHGGDWESQSAGKIPAGKREDSGGGTFARAQQTAADHAGNAYLLADRCRHCRRHFRARRDKVFLSAARRGAEPRTLCIADCNRASYS